MRLNWLWGGRWEIEQLVNGQVIGSKQGWEQFSKRRRRITMIFIVAADGWRWWWKMINRQHDLELSWSPIIIRIIACVRCQYRCDGGGGGGGGVGGRVPYVPIHVKQGEIIINGSSNDSNSQRRTLKLCSKEEVLKSRNLTLFDGLELICIRIWFNWLELDSVLILSPSLCNCRVNLILIEIAKDWLAHSHSW